MSWLAVIIGLLIIIAIVTIPYCYLPYMQYRAQKKRDESVSEPHSGYINTAFLESVANLLRTNPEPVQRHFGNFEPTIIRIEEESHEGGPLAGIQSVHDIPLQPLKINIMEETPIFGPLTPVACSSGQSDFQQFCADRLLVKKEDLPSQRSSDSECSTPVLCDEQSINNIYYDATSNNYEDYLLNDEMLSLPTSKYASFQDDEDDELPKADDVPEDQLPIFSPESNSTVSIVLTPPTLCDEPDEDGSGSKDA